MLHGNIFQTQTLEQKEHFFSSIDFAFYVLKHLSKVLLTCQENFTSSSQAIGIISCYLNCSLANKFYDNLAKIFSIRTKFCMLKWRALYCIYLKRLDSPPSLHLQYSYLLKRVEIKWSNTCYSATFHFHSSLNTFPPTIFSGGGRKTR